jgi:hypothetical protein
VLVHGKITTRRTGRPMDIIMLTVGWENLREEKDKNMNTFVTLKFRGGCSLSVLNQGKEGQEEKCPCCTVDGYYCCVVDRHCFFLFCRIVVYTVCKS